MHVTTNGVGFSSGAIGASPSGCLGAKAKHPVEKEIRTDREVSHVISFSHTPFFTEFAIFVSTPWRMACSW